MPTIDIEQARAALPGLIKSLIPGEKLLIEEEGAAIASLTRLGPRKWWPCKAGSAKNTVHWMAPDFDEPLEEFREYMDG
jgi:hypothetical protein